MNANDVHAIYRRSHERIRVARQTLNRPLTLTEKVLYAHLDDGASLQMKRTKSYADLRPDRVAMQDATAQMALLQFMRAGMNRVAVPSTVHCDHLILAHEGARKDLLRAVDENREIYDFLRIVSEKYGLGFWKPGAGIIHQVVLENYAFPGGMMIGTDSHTPNAGGLGMIAVGVGGADAVDVMVGETWGVRWPGVIGVNLTGKLSGWASPKDVILDLLGILTVKGGTGHIVEFFGEGTRSLSCTGKATICNMGAEHGATTSIFPFDDAMARYLQSTRRGDIADLARTFEADLRADSEAEANPESCYDRVIHIDLDALEPYINGPHTPDLARPISTMAQAVESEGYPDDIRQALIGSCTNSSYEDIQRAASIVRKMNETGVRLKTPLLVTPGSDQIMQTIERDGLLSVFEKAGATVLANACGPCIGQWQRDDIKPGERNTIVNSYNRNFARRNDGNAETLSFIGSPELVVALAYAGKLSFDPVHAELDTASGKIKLPTPTGDELPPNGFEFPMEGYIAPAVESDSIVVAIDPKSDRIQELKPFPRWDGQDITGLKILLKARGKCTTDHISAAGEWLRFRGHLDNISDNMFLGANNAFTKTPGTSINVMDGSIDDVPSVARAYKALGVGWVAIGDENYGEGSSREHAAMSPRHLGARAVIARSFARIHETNLKKQGVLPLTFLNPSDYDLIQATDEIDIVGLKHLAPGKPVEIDIRHDDGTSDRIKTQHTLSENQILWFKAGSALNAIAESLGRA
jgi:aconitate hydratase